MATTQVINDGGHLLQSQICGGQDEREGGGSRKVGDASKGFGTQTQSHRMRSTEKGGLTFKLGI